MKSTVKFLFTLVVATLFFTTACKKDNGNDALGGDDMFSAMIDGESFERTGFEAYATESIIDPEYSIYGTNIIEESDVDKQLTVYITVPTANGEGTFDMDDDVYAYVVDGAGNAWATINDGGSGEVTIDKFTEGEKVEGTFSFTAVSFTDGSTREVTDGEFNVDWQ